jgi:hypothetical protein
MKNQNNIKIITVLALLSFTCFLTQCQACQKKDPVTEKILPNQILYSISCGFPLPYFDVDILTGTEKEFYYAVGSPYRIAITVAVNIIVVSILYVLIKFLILKSSIMMDRLLIITLSMAALFSMGLLAPYLPEFVKTIFLYVYIYPVGYIGSFFEYANITLPDNNLPPRIYMVLSIIFFYLLSALFSHALSMRKIRHGKT